MDNMETFRRVNGEGAVIVSIREEHINKVFEAIGDELPDKMVDMPSGGFILLWEGVEFEYELSKWYTNLVDLLESIEEEYDDSHFSIEAAVWSIWEVCSVDYYSHGAFGGFSPIITYSMWGTVVDPKQFTKKK